MKTSTFYKGCVVLKTGTSLMQLVNCLENKKDEQGKVQ
jgi:hypothetical protein